MTCVGSGALALSPHAWMYRCPFCTLQRQMFGAAGAQGLPYVECAEDGVGASTGVCRSKDVTSYPSWQINGKVYAGLQTLTALQALSGFDPAVKFPEFVPPGAKPKPKPPPGGFRPPKVDGKSSPEQIALAQHLGETGARFYGAYWCRYCDKQRQMFGAEVLSRPLPSQARVPALDALLSAASVPPLGTEVPPWLCPSSRDRGPSQGGTEPGRDLHRGQRSLPGRERESV
jgi:hypothetical protein